MSKVNPKFIENIKNFDAVKFFKGILIFFKSRFDELIKEVNALDYFKIRRSIKYLTVLNVVLFIFILFEILYAKNSWHNNEEKRIIIEPGMNLDQVIYLLKSNEIIESPLLFKLYAKLLGKDQLIISKNHLFKSGMTNAELLILLTDPNAYEVVSFTAPPGFSIRMYARLIERKLFLSGEKFIEAASNDSLLALIGMKGKVKNLEGFLYPDTYFISSAMDEKDIVRIMFNEFRKKVYYNNELQQELSGNNKELLETIIMASIIEGETRIEEERYIVSGVYHNRLKRGMRLEADPTVQYALPDGPKVRLLYEDLRIDSPYNTYRNRGLPPGPVNNPTLASIIAALNPAQHDYIFFVATGDGGHKFTSTYQQHLEAVREYRIKMERIRSAKRDSTAKQ
jgi:UPF0755 protein